VIPLRHTNMGPLQMRRDTPSNHLPPIVVGGGVLFCFVGWGFGVVVGVVVGGFWVWFFLGGFGGFFFGGFLETPSLAALMKICTISPSLSHLSRADARRQGKNASSLALRMNLVADTMAATSPEVIAVENPPPPHLLRGKVIRY